MVDRFEADGAWEIPQEYKGARFSGTLRLDQNIGAELKSSKPANATEDIRNILNPSSDRIVIRGQIKNSIDITLYECIYFGSNSFGGINNITYRPRIVITGKQPNDLDNVFISAVRFMSPALGAVFRSQPMMYRLSKTTFHSDYSRQNFYRKILICIRTL